MNPLVLTCLLCFICSVGAHVSETKFSGKENGVTGGPASGEDVHNSLSNDDDELETDDEPSGGAMEHGGFLDFHPSKDERKKRRGKSKRRNRHRGKSTTDFNPEHTFFTNSYTLPFSTTEDPCTTSHLGYCIHGYCKHIEGVQEPACICMKGYDGERCGIQTLGSKTDEGDGPDHVQMVLVVIAVVLSIISCVAVVFMICAHYRSHKNFLASYLGTALEKEKLQKPIGELVV